MSQSRSPAATHRLHDHPVVNRIRAFDERIDKAIEPLRTPALDHVFYPLSSAADHGLLWLAIGAVRGTYRRHPIRDTLTFGAVLGAESFITNMVVKSFFKRVRPELTEAPTAPLPYGLHRPRTTSFPSGHATSAFTAAGFLSEGSSIAPAYTTLAVLVAASRVYVRMHHASDVLAGSALGYGFGRAARRVAKGLRGTRAG